MDIDRESREVISEQGVASSNHTLGLWIGSVSCAIKCGDDQLYHRLQHLYRDFLTERPADITVNLETTNRLSQNDLSRAIPETVYTHKAGEGFWTNSQIIAGKYDLSNRIIRIFAESSLGDPDWEFNHLNRLVSLTYYSACKVKYDGIPPAMLVHACGILHSGQVIVFAGPNETGKTTIAQLCSQWGSEVLNDEMLLISRPSPAGNGIYAQGAPIVGGTSSRLNISAPLRCILLLKRSNKTKLNHLGKTEAYLRFMRQIITPAYIGQRRGKDVFSLMADFSTELVTATSFYELEFNLDGDSLWQTVMELEKSREERTRNDSDTFNPGRRHYLASNRG
ncbi:MAG: hypothetical protein AMJ43_07360 [Coxiella sp. DG_40]|nr:MAG: hypothetical protein AMJ43_07360 [Coxiella sp. DG_40]